MNNIKVVSGYIPLAGVINVSSDQFYQLGHRLRKAIEPTAPARFFDDPYKDRLTTTWMWRWILDTFNLGEISSSDPAPDPSRFRTPHDKLLSNMIMHQKYEWLALAAIEDPEPEVFIWIDYGVLKQENMSPLVITEFLQKVKKAGPIFGITAPGVRPLAKMPDPKQSWDRFCGSVVIVPRGCLFQLCRWMKQDAMHHASRAHEVTIESNTLARAEIFTNLPFNWYQSWWGASMFTSYQAESTQNDLF